MNTQTVDRRIRFAGVTSLIILLVAVLAAPLQGLASAPAQNQQGPRSITIPANGTATLKVRGFCLDYGKPFPTEQMNATRLADPKIRQALNYAINKGYTEGNPLQTEQAIWFLRDGQWRATDHTVGQEIVDNATDANAPTDTGEGTSVVDALTGGQVQVTARFTPQTADAFYGDGDAEIRNLTANEIRVFMPVGVVFAVGTGGGTFQDLVAYEIGTQNVQVGGTPQITAQATITQQPTTEPTLTAVTTPAAAETPTTAPTQEAAPTQAPTEAPIATATQAPAPTETPAAPAPTENPNTGAGEDLLLALLVLATALGFGSIFAGMAMKRKSI